MEFKKIKLKNGLTIIHEKREIDVTTVMLAVKFGSIHETEKEKGIAHFIEHLCFKGTEKRTAKQIASELEKVGGILNAFTSEEETAYHVKLPSQHLNLAMEVIFDIFFNPAFPEEEVVKEGNVICEEIKMYKDMPQYRVFDKIKSCLYKNPFGISIIGTKENIHSMTREQLIKKHREIYHPQNAILSVVGNNDFDEIVKMAEMFCVERNGIKLEKPKILFQHLKEIEKRKSLEQASLCIGFHFPASNEKEKYAADVFSAILGSGMSSKLFTEVRERRGLAYSVKSVLDFGKEYSYIVIYIGTDKNKIDDVIKICLEEFKKMKEITEKELEEGKRQVIGRHEVDSEDCAATATNLILEEISENAGNYYNYRRNIENVSMEEIKKLSEFPDYASFVLVPDD